MAQQDKRNFNEIKKENQEKQQAAVESYVKEVVNKNEEAKKKKIVVSRLRKQAFEVLWKFLSP